MLGRSALGILAAALVILLDVILLDVIAVSAQTPGEIAPALHVDAEPWTAHQSVVTGYVVNASEYRVSDVQLRVDAIDAAGQHLDPVLGWVYGDVPGRGGRAWFRVDVPARAATCSVSVIFFSLVAPETPQAP